MSQAADLFVQINNAVLDLQASHLQTFETPLKTLARLLHHPDLEPINRSLTERVDFEAFMAVSELTGGGMGSHKLAWPDDPEQVLGLRLIMIDKLAENANYAVSIGHRYFDSGQKIIAGIHSLTSQMIIPFIRDYKAYIMSHGDVKPRLIAPKSNKIFIVHGHAGEPREAVARFLERLCLEPIILHEQANQGRTLIEKFEDHADVGFAIVLLTPDDMGGPPGAPQQPRARQNVILELGYFIGRLTRARVCALKAGDVDLPSDILGIVWTPFDAGWKQALANELQAANYQIDWNRVMGA